MCLDAYIRCSHRIYLIFYMILVDNTIIILYSTLGMPTCYFFGYHIGKVTSKSELVVESIGD